MADPIYTASTANMQYKELLDITTSMARITSISELVEPLLPALANLFAANSITVHQYTADKERFRFLNPMIHGVKVDNATHYSDYYYQFDPFVRAAQAAASQGNSQVIRGSDVVDTEEFLNSEFYVDFLKPQKIRFLLVFCINTQTQPTTFMGLHRAEEDGDFSDEELSMAEMLAPHLSATIERVCLIDDLATHQWAVNSLSAELRKPAVVILDRDYSILFSNPEAVAILDIDASSDVPSGRIPEEVIASCESLGDASSRDERGRIEFEYSCRHGRIGGYVRGYNDERQNVRYIVGFGHQSDEVIQPKIYDRFELTPREVDIVRLVCSGMTNPQIADELFISNRTVQNHLRSIYQKVHVHNRTSLINRLISSG